MLPQEAPNNKPTALRVSELNRQVKRMLEVSYAQVWVSGELSGLARPSSGHWYFSLKDQKAQIRCAMFRGVNQRLRFQPKDGDEVIVRGKLSLYEGRGDYQLIVDSIEPAGLGALQAAFDALKLKLNQEGLFDRQHKKPIPQMAKRVCVITSRSGAVIHDIIHVTKRRFPGLEIILIPVKVQGEGAAQEIAKAIQLANDKQIADVLIVGRGGGSLEDLWAFNEELVARAIFDSALPIVSAIGHEVDVSIADMVADMRAPTPSAAAEYITPDQYELTQKLDDQHRRLQFLLRNKLHQSQQILNTHRNRLQSPSYLLAQKRLHAENLVGRLHQAAQTKIQNNAVSISKIEGRLERFHPKLQLAQAKHKTQHLSQKLSDIIQRVMSQQEHQLSLAANKLNLVSPLATMDRGYSVLLNNEKKAIVSPDQVEHNEVLTAKVKEGELRLKVQKTEHPQQELF